MPRTVGGLDYAGTTVLPMTVQWAWVGGVSDDSAKVKARIADSTTATLRYSTSPTLTSYSTASGTEGNDEVFTFTLSGLAADTTYYYGFAGSTVTGKFRSFPTEGEAASFSIATASCAGEPPDGGSADYIGPGNTSNTPVFAHVVTRDPLMFLHLGDRGYPDISTNNVPAFRDNYNENMQNANQLAMHLAMAVDYVWDDHDFGANNSSGASASKPAAQSVYREHVPHWTLPSGSLIYHTYVIGRVRFIICDARSERSSHGATDNSSKTVLGATQKQWLKDGLLAATEPLIVVATINPWIGTGGNSWGIYSTERAELAEYLEDNNLTERVLLLSGDNHFVAADDGTNSQYDTGSSDPGPVVAQFASMDGAFSANDGTWSEGIFKVRRQQYGTLDFADDGTEITVTVKGWALSASPGATEAELFSLQHVYTG